MKAVRYNGLGFPILVANPKYIDTEHGKALDVNPKDLQRDAFRALIEKPARFSGAELKFVRLHMGCTQQGFAALIGVERSSVAKWEAKDLKLSGMEAPSEIVVRLVMAEHAGVRLDDLIERVRPATRKATVGEPIRVAA